MQHASASGQGELELRYHRPGSDSGEGPPAEALAPLKRDGGENPAHNRPTKSPAVLNPFARSTVRTTSGVPHRHTAGGDRSDSRRPTPVIVSVLRVR